MKPETTLDSAAELCDTLVHTKSGQLVEMMSDISDINLSEQLDLMEMKIDESKLSDIQDMKRDLVEILRIINTLNNEVNTLNNEINILKGVNSDRLTPTIRGLTEDNTRKIGLLEDKKTDSYSAHTHESDRAPNERSYQSHNRNITVVKQNKPRIVKNNVP